MSKSVSPKKQNNGMIWGITVVISLVALVVMIALLVNWKLDPFKSARAIFVGGAIWAATIYAIIEIRARLRFAPVPEFLKKPNDWPITIITIAVLALGSSALWQIPAVLQIDIIGALVAIAVGAIVWAREATKPVFEVMISNDGNKLYLPAGSKLMQSLKANGYVLFAQCGGKGTCATCRCKIPAGLPQEKRAPTMYGPLNEKLRGEGWILSCQIVLNSDITVELFKPLVQKWPTPPVTVTPGPGTGTPTAPSKPATPAA
ncbi:2Fe-2S iron-sulfur cluster binding domain-containing protein [Candidatus Acetothermia bacterium]|nr:2Fe-2S iron-sulfur cluster binding domain-containing protein [Candidatus Acetothermia bacterium]MBI3460398.1 2Fe-2S iron-sulfur cluster binding domain-containing protein [Candidatus Acetothermia bacterium]